MTTIAKDAGVGFRLGDLYSWTALGCVLTAFLGFIPTFWMPVAAGKFAANPFDVIHRLSERTGAEAYLLPVPVFANSVADRGVLMKQYGIADVFALARRAALLFVSFGAKVSVHGLAGRLGSQKFNQADQLRMAGRRG